MQARPRSLGASLITAILAFGLFSSPAIADENDARQILKSMSDYLASEQQFSFDYDTTLEVVTTENQKLGIASSGTVVMQRPDKIHATRAGGFADLEMVFDGQKFNLLGKHAAVYVQIPVSGGIDAMIDSLRNDYGFALPAADLLASAPYDALMSEVIDVKDLGAGVIRGQLCDHLAFRTPDVDWQIWIAVDGRPRPCRFVITTHTLAQGPQYTIDILDWRTDIDIDENTFDFEPPTMASELDLQNLMDVFSELPEHYEQGETQ